jgi:cytochrome c-type biogenesis protein
MKKNDNTVILILILGLVLFALYSVYNHHKVANQPPPTKTSTDISTSSSRAVKGELAPEIVLQDLQGQTVKMSDYRGKVVILNFWASWCSPCKSEMPELDKAAQEFASGSDAVLLTVNMTDGTRETIDKARQYVDGNKFSLPVLLDTEGKAAQAYNITSIPTTFIIDKQGVLNQYFSGPATRDALNNYVNQLR